MSMKSDESEKDTLIKSKDKRKVYGDMDGKEEKEAFNLNNMDCEDSPGHKKINSLSRQTHSYIRRKFKMKIRQDEEFGGNVVEVPTTCFGDVEFKGATGRSKAKFVRLSDTTRGKDVLKLMINHWKVEPPQLLISVTGGAKAFKLDPILKHNFIVGLSKVASTPGTWVISGGTNAGVMKHVGDAMRGTTQTCIGIATWGAISHKASLVPKRSSFSSTIQDKNSLEYRKFVYESRSWLTEQGAYLDSNHTHFLLVDDGTENRYGGEIDFRGRFEQIIMSAGGRKGKVAKTVPTVLLVVEGGPNTIKTVLSAITGDNPVPVVIVKSSGRAADLLVFALEVKEEILDCHSKGEIHDELQSEIGEMFKYMNEKIRTGIYDAVVECIKLNEMLTVAQVGTDKDIDDAVLTAILNDSKTEAYRQLQLTLLWNRADLARDRILSKMLRWGNETNSKELRWTMMMALARDNVEFIQLLLEYGVSISSCLTNELLEFLYGYRSYFKTSPLKYLYSKEDYKPVPFVCENKKIYKRLCALADGPELTCVMLSRSKIEELIRDLCYNLIHSGDETFIEDITFWADKKNNTFDYPFRELFFWALLNNMQSMAVYFLKCGQEHMAKSLIGAHICNSLLSRRRIQGAIKTGLTETSDILRETTIQLLDECYRMDEKKTCLLITSVLVQFKEMSTLNIAVSSENLEFVSHYSVQGLLEKLWIGNIKMKNINLIKILFSYVFVIPIFLNAFEFKTVEEIQTSVQTEKAFEEEMVEEEEEDNTDEDVSDEELDEDSVRMKWKRTKRRMTLVERDAMIERGEGTQLSMYNKLVEFYWRTPVVTFVAHVIGYFAFLLLFSYVAMQRKTTPLPTVEEWILIATVFAFLVAEIYQIIQVDSPSLPRQIREWGSSHLNLYDAFVISLYFAALAARLCINNPILQQAGHLMYAIDCGLWIFRLLSVCTISHTLGPYLVMMKRMSKDLIIFLTVLFVIILGYGVITTSILTPFEKNFSINMLRNPIWKPYFNIYGELFTDEPDDNSTTRFGTSVIHSYDETVVWILMGIYLLFTNILLLNLLIAVFNNTYNEVQAKASQIWAFKRYHLIMEYADRHALFPPLSLLGHIALIFRWLYRKCMQTPVTDIHGLRSVVSEEDREDLLQFECSCMTVMSRKKFTSIKKNLDEMTAQVLDEMEDMKSEIENIREKVQQCTDEFIEKKRLDSMEECTLSRMSIRRLPSALT